MPGMTAPWLTLIGIGEDGLAGLPPPARAALDAARAVFGGPRHLALAAAGDRGRPWPVPFDAAPVLACRGQPTVVLASGDPFWHGAGGSLAPQLAPGEWISHPAPSTFQLAANRLGWRLETVTCLGLHAAPFARLTDHLHPGTRILATLAGPEAVAALAVWLAARGQVDARLTVLERLGGPAERIRAFRADTPPPETIAAPVAVAIAPGTRPGLPATPGLPDTAFAHDGQITKAAVRALTLAALAPRPGEHLWDIGAGSGSVSVEFARAGGRATAVEPRPDRAATIAANALAFGLDHRVAVVTGAAPAALPGLAPPDAVFVGGGASADLFDHLWTTLPPGTRLVTNAVTVETQALLGTLHHRHGGRLSQIALAETAPLGRFLVWEPAHPLWQWSVTR
jgi:precorrin-6Y C5,15-methyltransferase (decarboxylating)